MNSAACLTLCDGYAANGPLYGGLALVFLGAAALLLLFLLWAAGHRPGQEGIVLSPVDRVFSEVWLAALAVGTLYVYLFSGPRPVQGQRLLDFG